MLSVTNLTAGYRRDHDVLTRISITLTPGRIVGVQGPSGCGKSTLIRVLALLHPPRSGDLRLDGETVRRFRYAAPAAQRRRVGVVFQHPRAAADPRHTLRRIVSAHLPAGAPGTETDRLAELVGLTPDLLDRRPHEVSDGQLQRACLARTLGADPRYLLCDEMTAMLDASSAAALVHLIKAQVEHHGRGALMVSHDSALLDACCDETVQWHDLGGPPAAPTGR
ncbi:ABC-type dipeptide/oligopeptide/nickel transport system, ATPase component [Thermomonospora echinospora]|uniref:ABC-type dipeptide/oligopeptide/nickel transport system, ATPase component n=1 Tax=Thermomonospora echinospora TaxID=1992 RepID=A0A1H5XA12_9ACTN|nr:ATP-binding cassette domain-containing protein [Thermomonospora echinospora]SEG08579.1 ABC-type dipeptide/oligopeptide/nickel transport system, ATPase component [Thermomonospora echinospora]